MPRFAGILLVRADGAVLLAKRAPNTSEAGYWSIPGGRVDPSESVVEAALRELDEEMGSVPPIQLVSTHPVQIPRGIYTTIIATISNQAAACWCPQLNWEHTDCGWFYPQSPPRPLHPGVALFI